MVYRGLPSSFCFFKQKTAYDMRISDWSSDVCSSDLHARQQAAEWIEAVELRWIEFERGGIAGDQRRRVVAGVAVRQAALEVHTGLRLQPAVEEIALKLQFLDPEIGRAHV